MNRRYWIVDEISDFIWVDFLLENLCLFEEENSRHLMKIVWCGQSALLFAIHYLFK